MTNQISNPSIDIDSGVARGCELQSSILDSPVTSHLVSALYPHLSSGCHLMPHLCHYFSVEVSQKTRNLLSSVSFGANSHNVSNIEIIKALRCLSLTYHTSSLSSLPFFKHPHVSSVQMYVASIAYQVQNVHTYSELQKYWPIQCNTGCCGIFDYCADWKTSTCCLEGEVALTDPSGYSTLCCGENQFNAGGICCNKGTQWCGAICCPGNCIWTIENPGSPTCQRTQAGCVALGGTGEFCSTSSNCAGSAYCDNGCCINAPVIP